jgi:deoxycytidylate deaminase
MKRITGDEIASVLPYFESAADEATKATCLQAKCGSVIISSGDIIGSGFNSPPQNDENRRTCGIAWDYSLKPKYDKTCCIHAEWRAIIDACKNNPDKLQGSTLYFIRINEDGDFTDAGVPYCTTCSRLTLESGIEYFALWNQDGADVYTVSEYDKKSYEFYATD